MASGNSKQGENLPFPVAAAAHPGSPHSPSPWVSGAAQHPYPNPHRLGTTGVNPVRGERVTRLGILYSNFRVHEYEGKQKKITSQANMKH